MSDNLEIAQRTFSKADRLLKIGLGVFLAFVLIVVTVTSVEVFTVQQQIAKNQKVNSQASNDRFARYTADNAAEHLKTQAYVKCIANVLLKPIDQRTDGAFNDCSKTADITTKAKE